LLSHLLSLDHWQNILYIEEVQPLSGWNGMHVFAQLLFCASSSNSSRSLAFFLSWFKSQQEFSFLDLISGVVAPPPGSCGIRFHAPIFHVQIKQD